jgi:hypothetical protein
MKISSASPDPQAKTNEGGRPKGRPLFLEVPAIPQRFSAGGSVDLVEVARDPPFGNLIDQP